MDPVLIPVGLFATMALAILVFFRSRFTTVAVCTLFALGAGASVVCYGSSDDFLTCVGPSYVFVLVGLCITFYAGVLQDDEKRSNAQGAIFEECWRDICDVLDRGHEHAGGLIRGTYEGHPVEARASYLDLQPQASPVSVYRLSVMSGPGGRRWSVRPKRLRKSRSAWEWVIVARPKDFQKRLAEAGVLEALHAQPEIGVWRNPKIWYDPDRGNLTYTDNSGSVPDAETFHRQIKTLIALNAVNAEHNVGQGGPHSAR